MRMSSKTYHNVNTAFLEALGTNELNSQMNEYLVEDVGLNSACKWLRNIRTAHEKRSPPPKTTDAASVASAASASASPIVANHKEYGLPDIPESLYGEIKILRLFVVGCGARATGYLNALLGDYIPGTCPYEIAGVADPVKSRREQVIHMAQDAKLDVDSIRQYDDWRHVKPDDFDAMNIDVAMIMTMDRDHADPAVYFMKNGCHVIVEKPLDATPEQIQVMIDAMHQYKRIAAVCTVLEYTSHARKMKELIQLLGYVEDLLIREQVGWHHDGYAYGAGPFSSAIDTSPYAIAKTIHDMSMGLALTRDSVRSLIYMPSESRASRGKYGKEKVEANEIYDPHSYLAKFTHKLIAQMKANQVLENPELDLPDVDDLGHCFTIDQIIAALCGTGDAGDAGDAGDTGKHLINIPDSHEGMIQLSDANIQDLANLYRSFHLYLAKTNYWCNIMMHSGNTCDQPAGFTIVANMEGGCQFKMICSIQSADVCVRHYQVRCEYGQIISDFPEISCTKFGTAASRTDLGEDECYVPDESTISKRGMHGGADAMFAHTVARQIGHAMVQIEEMAEYKSQNEIDNFVESHHLNTHFQANAELTIAILKAVENPNDFVEV